MTDRLEKALREWLNKHDTPMFNHWMVEKEDVSSLAAHLRDEGWMSKNEMLNILANVRRLMPEDWAVDRRTAWNEALTKVGLEVRALACRDDGTGEETVCGAAHIAGEIVDVYGPVDPEPRTEEGEELYDGWSLEDCLSQMAACLEADPHQAFHKPGLASAGARHLRDAVRKLAALRAQIQAIRERVERLTKFVSKQGDDAYCDGVRMAQEPLCCGWEAKVQTGKFGKAEHDAHAKCNEMFGAHRAYRDVGRWIANAAIDEITGGKE